MPAKLTLRSAISSSSCAKQNVALRQYVFSAQRRVDVRRGFLPIGRRVDNFGPPAQTVSGDENIRERAHDFAILYRHSGRLEQLGLASLPGRAHQHVARDYVSRI